MVTDTEDMDTDTDGQPGTHCPLLLLLSSCMLCCILSCLAHPDNWFTAWYLILGSQLYCSIPDTLMGAVFYS